MLIFISSILGLLPINVEIDDILPIKLPKIACLIISRVVNGTLDFISRRLEPPLAPGEPGSCMSSWVKYRQCCALVNGLDEHVDRWNLSDWSKSMTEGRVAGHPFKVSVHRLRYQHGVKH